MKKEVDNVATFKRNSTVTGNAVAKLSAGPNAAVFESLSRYPPFYLVLRDSGLIYYSWKTKDDLGKTFDIPYPEAKEKISALEKALEERDEYKIRPILMDVWNYVKKSIIDSREDYAGVTSRYGPNVSELIEYGQIKFRSSDSYVLKCMPFFLALREGRLSRT